MHNKNRQKGIGLLELMLALAIIATLLFMVTHFFNIVYQSQKIKQAVTQIEVFKATAEKWWLVHGEFSGDLPEKFRKAGYLKADELTQNPWGGAYDVKPYPASGGTKIEVIMKDIPRDICEILKDKLLETETSVGCGDQPKTDYHGVFLGEFDQLYRLFKMVYMYAKGSYS